MYVCTMLSFLHYLLILLTNLIDKAAEGYRAVQRSRQEVTELGSRSASNTRAISSLFNTVPACHYPEKSKCLIGKYVCAKRVLELWPQ